MAQKVNDKQTDKSFTGGHGSQILTSCIRVSGGTFSVCKKNSNGYLSYMYKSTQRIIGWSVEYLYIAKRAGYSKTLHVVLYNQ